MEKFYNFNLVKYPVIWFILLYFCNLIYVNAGQVWIRLDASNAVLTSSDADINDASACLDGNTSTIMRSANINPAFVEIAFTNAQNVDSVGVLVGQNNLAIDRDIWWLEAADNSSDLQNKSGSYVLVVPQGNVCGNGWDTKKLTSGVQKKIWRFTVKRVYGDNYVHISELALYSLVDESSIISKISIGTELLANNIVINNSANLPATEVFDKSMNTGLSFGGQSSSHFLMSIKKPIELKQIKLIFNSTCNWYVEYADSYSDLNSKQNSYQVSITKQSKPLEWDSVDFPQVKYYKHIRIKMQNNAADLKLNEIELISKVKEDKLIGLQYDLELWQGWRWRNIQEYLLFNSNDKISKSLCTWQSTDNSIATVDNNGNIRAVNAGSCQIIASYLGNQSIMNLKVVAPVKQIEKETLTDFMSKPAKDFLYEVPIIIVQYIPTTDGTNRNSYYSPDYIDLKNRTILDEKKNFLFSNARMKFALEEGSKFRHYKNPDSKPSIGIKVVDYITIYEPMPPGLKNDFYDNGILKYAMDFERLAEQINLRDYIENKGVKYVWINGNGTNAFMPHYNPDLIRPETFKGFFESYMATPGNYLTCNGVNPEPLPTYNKTYTVINQYMGDPTFKCVNFEPFTHQFESLLLRQNELQDGNHDLLWNKFVGKIGRCGWTHTPPNTEINYGYFHYIQIDPNKVQPYMCDIEDWKPDNSGEKKLISYHSWEDIQYNWPDGVNSFVGREELQWFIYWLQSIPGRDNCIEYVKGGNNYEITNWWRFFYDWDYYATNENGLYGAPAQRKTEIVNMPHEICAGSKVTIKFDITGTFKADNRFDVLLSDANGDFTKINIVGSSVGSKAGQIEISIPINTEIGTNYKLKITSTNPQSTSIENGKKLIINSLPNTTIFGKKSSCKNATEVYYCQKQNGVNYKWSVENGIIVGNDNDSLVKIVWHSTNEGKVKIKVTNSNLCISNDSIDVKLFNSTKPEINGSKEVCSNRLINYSSKFINDDEIQETLWKVEGGEIFGCNNCKNVNIKWGNSNSGVLKLYAYNKNNCVDSAIFSVKINQLPNVIIEGTNSACFNQSYEYITETDANCQNSWVVFGGYIEKQISNEKILVKWNQSNSGKVILSKSNTITGCMDSSEYIVEVFEELPIPTITRTENKLISSIETGNQWYLNGEILVDSTKKIIYPSISGSYSIKYSLNECVSDFSEGYNYIINSVNNYENKDLINIYPNPTTGLINLENLVYENIPIKITISNLLGEDIFIHNLQSLNNISTIDLSQLGNGIYFIKIESTTNITTKKLIINR